MRSYNELNLQRRYLIKRVTSTRLRYVNAREGKVDSSILFSLIPYIQKEHMQREWMKKNKLSNWVEYLSNKSVEEISLDLSPVQVYKELKRLYGTPIEKPEAQALIQKYLSILIVYR